MKPEKPPGKNKRLNDKAVVHATADAEKSKELLAVAKTLRLKKRFSQNFLVNPAVLNAIVDLVQPREQDTILEIGPGAGFLTRLLLEKAPKALYAVELDKRMAAYLGESLPQDQFPFFNIEQADILYYDWSSIQADTIKVVGNLPYSITSKILFHLAGELDVLHHPLRQRIQQTTLMVQKEVAERIVASPGQKAYNALSVALQVWFNVTLNKVVPAAAFYPVPKVKSAIVTLVPRDEPLVAAELLSTLAKLVKAGFSQKRKTLRNALHNTGFAPLDVIEKTLATQQISSQLRAEALSIEAFGKLADAFNQNTCKS
ncbi:MAG: 16S rRNA (adenine(1518)-N(6)/adenine(1519)-N(6))-dimethyltransferase RsmA [Cyanobacteria bacterium P01_H01_bin.74]